MELCIIETRQKVDKKTENEVKFKNQPKIFTQTIFKSLENHELLRKKILIPLQKSL